MECNIILYNSTDYLVILCLEQGVNLQKEMKYALGYNHTIYVDINHQTVWVIRTDRYPYHPKCAKFILEDIIGIIVGRGSFFI